VNRSTGKNGKTRWFKGKKKKKSKWFSRKIEPIGWISGHWLTWPWRPKSSMVLSASWRSREAGVYVIQSESKDLKTRGTNGVSSSSGPKAQKSGGNGLSPSPSLKAQEPGVPMSQGRRWMSQLKQRRNSPFCCLFFYSGSQLIGWCLPTLVKMIFFTQSIGSNANLSWKHLHRHTQKCFNGCLGTP